MATPSSLRNSPQPPIALTIAGSDSGGGAGIQADLKTFHTFRVFGTSVITATTAQNTLGVTDVHPIPLKHVRAQLDAVAADLAPGGVKSGMLATAALVSEVAQGIRRHELENYVLDPVMVASSGDRLLAEDAEAAVLQELVPLATLVTPNLHEAEVLLGRAVQSPAQMARAARDLVDAGAGAVLVKGGHLEGKVVIDILWDGRNERRWSRPRLASRNTHGTGCTLSAAVAAGLARGWPLGQAVDRALAYLAEAIATAPELGQGHGPVNHFAPADLSGP